MCDSISASGGSHPDDSVVAPRYLRHKLWRIWKQFGHSLWRNWRTRVLPNFHNTRPELMPPPDSLEIPDRKSFHLGEFGQQILAHLFKKTAAPFRGFLSLNDLFAQEPVQLQHRAIDRDGGFDLGRLNPVFDRNDPFAVFFVIDELAHLASPSTGIFIARFFAMFVCFLPVPSCRCS